jgi:hypothetical protein
VKERDEERAASPRGPSQEERSEAARPEAERGDRDDPEVLATQAREGIEKSAAELRKQRVPIATEPPTVYRP